MNNLLSNFLIFATGAAIGSVVTWKLIETKYKRIADEEIASVKEVYARRYGSETKTEEDRSEDVMVESQYDNKMSIQEYASRITNLGYTKEDESVYKEYRKPDKVEKDSEEEEDDDDWTDDEEFIPPYIISPEDFDDPDVGYETISLIYYMDGVLAYDDGQVIAEVNIDKLVPKDFYMHFGEYAGADDSVFVRNEWLEHDYEILRDYNCWHNIYQPDNEDYNEGYHEDDDSDDDEE